MSRLHAYRFYPNPGKITRRTGRFHEAPCICVPELRWVSHLREPVKLFALVNLCKLTRRRLQYLVAKGAILRKGFVVIHHYPQVGFIGSCPVPHPGRRSGPSFGE